MKTWHALLFFCFMSAVAQNLYSQEAAENGDIQASLKSCRVIQMSLNARDRMRASGDVPEDDDFTAASRACSRLDAAISTSDSTTIQSATNDLRPLLAGLALSPASPREQLEASEKKAAGLTGKNLFYELPNLGKRAFDAGEIDKAELYARQLLRMAPKYPKDWNYGNAIFYGNFVLGRVSVKRQDFATAGKYLLLAGATPGSPQLDSFGPNMTLANELVNNGKPDVVLQYLMLCKNFWKMDSGKLDDWSAVIRAGGKPDFSSYLSY